MAQSEIARERRNIRRIIARGAERGVKFDIPLDLNTATLDELKAYHRDIYNYASAHDQMFGELHGQDVKKYENRKRTAHARGKETISVDYEIDMEQNPAETYDENRDQFPYDNVEPDYNDIDTLPGENRSEYTQDWEETPSWDDYWDWADGTMPEDETVDMVISQIRDLASQYNNEEGGAALEQQIDIAIAQEEADHPGNGKARIASRIAANRDNFLKHAEQVIKYWGLPGRGAQETRLRNYDSFLSILFDTAGGSNMERAEEIANTGTTLASKLKNMEPPKGATTFDTLEAGLALDYKRFWYKNESGGWSYYDSRKKQ